MKEKRVCFVHCADPRWVGTYNEIARGLEVIHVPAIGSDLGDKSRALTKLTSRYHPTETFFLFSSHWPCGAFNEEGTAKKVAEDYALYFASFGYDAALLHLSNKNIVYPSLHEISNVFVQEMIRRADSLSINGWIIDPDVRPEKMHVRHHFESPLKEGDVFVSSSFVRDHSINVIKRVCGRMPHPHYGEEVSESTRELILSHI